MLPDKIVSNASVCNGHLARNVFLARNDASAINNFVKFEVASWPKMAMNQNGFSVRNCVSARNLFSANYTFVKFDCGFLATNALLLKVLKDLARLWRLKAFRLVSISVLSRLFCLSKDPQVKIGPFLRLDLYLISKCSLLW